MKIRLGWLLLAALIIGGVSPVFFSDAHAQQRTMEQEMRCPYCGHRWVSYNYGRDPTCPSCGRDRHGNLPSSGNNNSSGQTVDYGAQRREAERREEYRREEERREEQRRETERRNAERREKAERKKNAGKMRKQWDETDQESLMAYQEIFASNKKKRGRTQSNGMKKLTCAFCVNGERDCPYCEDGTVHCARSGCINGYHVCGCVTAANNFQPDPKCPHCKGSGKYKCDACDGRGSWDCPHCTGGKIPCPFCNGLAMATDARNIRPTPIGGTPIRSFSPLTVANQTLTERVLGPNRTLGPLSQQTRSLLTQQKNQLFNWASLHASMDAMDLGPVDSQKTTEEQKELQQRKQDLILHCIDTTPIGSSTNPSVRNDFIQRVNTALKNDSEYQKL